MIPAVLSFMLGTWFGLLLMGRLCGHKADEADRACRLMAETVHDDAQRIRTLEATLQIVKQDRDVWKQRYLDAERANTLIEGSKGERT